MKNSIETKDVENIVLKNNVSERVISDVKYAPMWVKLVMIWAGTIFGGAILLALANLVIKK